MKKMMALAIAMIVLVCTLWFSTGSATAAGTITYKGAHFVWGKGIAFIFEASGYKNSDVKGATLMIGSSSFDAHCTVSRKDDKIVCVVGSGLTQYAGQIGVLSFAGHAFYVKIPDRPPFPSVNGNQSLSCPPGMEIGADVHFLLPLDGPYTQFVSGSTLTEVQQNAQKIADDLGASITGIDNLECHQ